MQTLFFVGGGTEKLEEAWHDAVMKTGELLQYSKPETLGSTAHAVVSAPVRARNQWPQQLMPQWRSSGRLGRERKGKYVHRKKLTVLHIYHCGNRKLKNGAADVFTRVGAAALNSVTLPRKRSTAIFSGITPNFSLFSEKKMLGRQSLMQRSRAMSRWSCRIASWRRCSHCHRSWRRRGKDRRHIDNDPRINSHWEWHVAQQ